MKSSTNNDGNKAIKGGGYALPGDSDENDDDGGLMDDQDEDDQHDAD